MPPAAGEEEVAARLPLDLRELWCSPWARALAVAEALSRRLHLPLLVDARLSELHMGEFEGRPFLELEREPAFSTWMRNPAIRTQVRPWRTLSNQVRDILNKSGGGGNRTRVRKHSPWQHYMLVPWFVVIRRIEHGHPARQTIFDWISPGAVEAPRQASPLFCRT
jgi:hypothetical protein